MSRICLIACISQDGGLGYRGELLWHIPEDMKFFRKTTQGSTVVMGRKTYESIGRPLPNRTNVVLSSRPVKGDVVWCRDLDELRSYLDEEKSDNIYIIGGATLYGRFLATADEILLTEVSATKPADVFFPDFDRTAWQTEVLSSDAYDNIEYRIIKYIRRRD